MGRPIQTHCKRGHPFTEWNRKPNTYAGGTCCRLCCYLRNAARKRRLRKEARGRLRYEAAYLLLQYLERNLS